MVYKWKDSKDYQEHKELKLLEKKLSDRYAEPTFLGSGGFSKVFKVIDCNLDRACALKVLQLNQLKLYNDQERKDAMSRFTKEARTYAKCRHPNIMEIYDIGIIGDFPYILVEYIRGRTLAAHIASSGIIEEKQILRISESILPAVGTLHNKGIIHRDLKPANIMTEDDEKKRIILIDFGIVKTPHPQKLTASDIILGAPAYIAPEMWENNHNVTAQTDIYAMGVILFEMVTGDIPFKGPPALLMEAHMKAPIPKINEKNPDAPKGLQEIIEKAMAKKSEFRFKNVDEMLTILRKTL